MSTNCQPRPAKQSPPDERDLRIFKLAEIHHLAHDKIACELGDISRRRVSQIVQEVRIWLATHPADDPALATEIERQRLARNMERMRLEDIIERAVHGLNTAPIVLKTTRSTEGGPITRTLRDQPPVDVRLLKTYLRAVTALGKLNERPEPPPPPKEEQPWSHPKIQEVVKAWQLDTHNYLVTDENLATFAEDLTVAFLDCFGRPPSPADEAAASDSSELCEGLPTPHDGASSASQISQPEALDGPDIAAAADEASSWQNESSAADSNGESASQGAEISSEKPKKGSADIPSGASREQPANDEPQYVKRMLIGRLPPNHPAHRHRPVTELQINSQHPGVTVSPCPTALAPPAKSATERSTACPDLSPRAPDSQYSPSVQSTD